MVIIMNIVPTIHLRTEEVCKVTWRINGTNDSYPSTSISSQLSASESPGLDVERGGQVVELQ